MKCMEFEALKNYESLTVYFCEHEMNHSCLIALQFHPGIGVS